MSKNIKKIDLIIAPGANIDAYIKTVSSIVLLSIEEEKKLANSLYYKQDLEAARKLIMSHLRFVVHIAKSYTGYGLPLADLIQEGNVGLMKAVKRFNPEVGVRLISFSVHWIKAEIHEFILKNWRIVKIATTKAQRKLFFNLRSAKKKLAWLSNDEIQQIAKDLGVKVQQISEMEGRLSSQDKSFEAPSEESSTDLSPSPEGYIEDNSFDPYKLVAQKNWDDVSVSKLKQAIEILDERSKDIIYSRWLSDSKNTLFNLAAKYQISAERIRQLERSAFKKIKGQLTDFISDHTLRNPA